MISGKTECKHGHPFDAENTRFDVRTGRRSCIECGRIRSREHQRKKRGPHDRAYLYDLDLYNQKATQRLHASYRIDASTGCWPWTAGLDQAGYGTFYYLGTTFGAHRAAYLLLVGEVEPELDLDHLCRNRRCVNPGHLEPVSTRENILRGEGPTAQNAKKTHCPHGHKLAEGNLVANAARRGQRACLTCNREVGRRRSHTVQNVNRGPKGDATASGPSTDSVRSRP